MNPNDRAVAQPMDYVVGPQPAPAKHWMESRTLWVNAIAAGLVVLEASTGALQPHLPVNLYAALAVALPVVNAMLRVLTNQGVRG
jgi:hypothetical protein